MGSIFGKIGYSPLKRLVRGGYQMDLKMLMASNSALLSPAGPFIMDP